MLAGITDTIDPISGLASGGIDLAIPDIGGSITSALNFKNIQLNIFGCEFAPNVAKSTIYTCLLYTSPSPRDQRGSRMPSSA